MASYPVSLDAGINTELTSSSSRGPRIPGFKASSLYPPEAKERALTWSRLFFPYFKSFLPSGIGGDPDPCFFAVLGIRIRMFLGLPDPHPDPLVKSRIQIRILPSSSKNSKKNLYF
jgi:hypothetical protein